MVTPFTNDEKKALQVFDLLCPRPWWSCPEKSRTGEIRSSHVNGMVLTINCTDNIVRVERILPYASTAEDLAQKFPDSFLVGE